MVLKFEQADRWFRITHQKLANVCLVPLVKTRTTSRQIQPASFNSRYVQCVTQTTVSGLRYRTKAVWLVNFRNSIPGVQTCPRSSCLVLKNRIKLSKAARNNVNNRITSADTSTRWLAVWHNWSYRLIHRIGFTVSILSFNHRKTYFLI